MECKKDIGGKFKSRSTSKFNYAKVGLCGLCRHNFEHNRYAKASSIMPGYFRVICLIFELSLYADSIGRTN